MKSVHSHANLGQIILAEQIPSAELPPKRARNIILLLAFSVALMMTGFGIIMPVFARRLGELGGGVESLGFMTMAFALAQFIMAPFMGSLADRFGRRPLVLIALFAFTLANIGYLLASSTGAYIAVRAFGGALTAGLFPAAMGVISDIMPERERGRWIGIILGGYGAGMILGPALGGFLYDGWGFSAPFTVSAAMAAAAFVAAVVFVPETRAATIRHRETLRQRRENRRRTQPVSLWDTLPRPLTAFGLLLFLNFVPMFAFNFIEPQMVFFAYEELDWTTTQFGLVVGAYGLALVLGQTVFGQASDTYGRRPLIVLGLLLNSVLFVGIVFVTQFSGVLVIALIAGFGGSLTGPAISAYFIDISDPRYRSRIMGIKESSLALGGILGPLLVVFVSQLTTPRGIFVIGALSMLLAVALATTFLREPSGAKPPAQINLSSITTRQEHAQRILRTLVSYASKARKRAVNNY